jgi:hypothetical protein
LNARVEFWKSVHQVVACIRWWGTVTRRAECWEASKRRDAVLLYPECLMYAPIASNALTTLEIPPCNKDLLSSELLSDFSI